MGRLSGTKRRKKWRSKFGKPSIGSQVGSDLGGHLGKQGKLGGNNNLTNKAGNLTFSGLGKMLSGWLGGKAYADAMGQVTGKAVLKKDLHPNFVKRMEGFNLDVTNPKEGLKINIDTQRAIDGIKNEDVKNWLNKNLSQAVKNWRINHQMYYTPKIKPGDPRWSPQGTGSPKIDPQTERYLEWVSRKNPEGKTVADYEKLYANHIKSGIPLEMAMRMNPAETGSFHALIDDSTPENNVKISESTGQPSADTVGPTQGPLTKAQQLENIYQSQLGRSADAAGAKYWLDTHAQGDNVDWNNIARMIGASDEGKKFAAKNQLKITT